ncbi:hypothetical protein Tco_0339050 [Tanacetum coccineum]
MVEILAQNLELNAIVMLDSRLIGFETDRDDTKSQTGYVFVLNGEAVMEAVWIRKFISGLGIVPTINEPLNMHCDNSAAVHYANEPRIQIGARHYHRRYYYVRECVELGEIRILKVHTDNDLADWQGASFC